MTERPRPPRLRALPPHVVEAFRDTAPRVSEADLLHRLESALVGLPPDERAAVVASVGYAEGAVGAAMEVELEPEQAERLAQRGLARLRTAMADVQDDEDEPG